MSCMHFYASSDPCLYTTISSLYFGDQQEDALEEGAVLLPHLGWQIQHPDSLWWLYPLIIGSRLEHETFMFFSEFLLRWETRVQSLFESNWTPGLTGMKGHELLLSKLYVV